MKIELDTNRIINTDWMKPKSVDIIESIFVGACLAGSVAASLLMILWLVAA